MKKIGFIGQGWIGKNYADDLEERGYTVVRYALEEPYAQNKDAIQNCEIVFIAVPTPTTASGFDDRVLRAVLPLIGKGNVAVIKSTMVPGTTKALQGAYPDIHVFHSPEFLSKKTAAEEARNPDRNVVGVPELNEKTKELARSVLDVLPKAPYELICDSKEAEFIKYTRNTFSYVMIVFANIMYDVADGLGLDWDVVAEAMSADEHIPDRYTKPVHQGGRGAGGCCFIKDFEAFIQYSENILDKDSVNLIKDIRDRNLELLKATHKDKNYVCEVYGGDDC